ncbi:MAG: hypothetical protein ACRC67_00260 [Inquilinus sp.]|uniref:hypothetical protein n=1 Tax=Inquilinus sp. TaxID=1932117 RepID=UPI003F2FE1A6
MATPSELRHTTIERGLIPLLLGNYPIRCEGRLRRVLVVEDDVVQADEVAEAIGAMGLETVGPIGCLEAAVALAETQELHGALLDVRLQRGLRVYPVVEVLWRRRIPFCFMTAYCDDRISAFPAEAVLYKPISLAASRAAVRTLIEA